MPISRDSGVLDDATDRLSDDDERDDEGADSRSRPRGVRRLGGWALLLSSAGAFWLVGCLPWIIDGMHLPPSLAWGQAFSADGAQAGLRTVHRVALPLSEAALATMLVVTVMGGVAAVLVSRLAGPWVRLPRATAAAGALLGAAGCLLQSRSVAGAQLGDASGATALLGALLFFGLLSSLLGLLVGLGVTGGGAWPRLLSLAFVAALLPSWLGDLVVRPGHDPSGWTLTVLQNSTWAGGLMLGLAFAFFGVQPAGRLFGWLLALAVAWVAPALIIGLIQVGGQVRSSTWGFEAMGDVLEVLFDYTVDYTFAALSPENHRFGPIVMAQTLGIFGAAILLIRSRRADPDA